MTQHLICKGFFSSSRLPLEIISKDELFGVIVKREMGFLLFQNKNNDYLYIKDFGGIAILTDNATIFTDYIAHLEQHYKVDIVEYVDEVDVELKQGTSAVGFGSVQIENLDVDNVHVIALNLAQSAALFYYQCLSDQLIEDTRKHTNQLEAKGGISLGRKSLMKCIGYTLNLKNKISENLFVFDSPMVAYENEGPGRLYMRIREDLDITPRYNCIKEQLNIIQENLDLFKDLSLHKHSSNLEWIIILLILFEVIHVVIEKVL